MSEVLPNGLVCVRFRNGHQVTAHLSKRDRQLGRRPVAGQTVMVELTPFDFSHGRIRFEEQL